MYYVCTYSRDEMILIYLNEVRRVIINVKHISTLKNKFILSKIFQINKQNDVCYMRIGEEIFYKEFKLTEIEILTFLHRSCSSNAHTIIYLFRGILFFHEFKNKLERTNFALPTLSTHNRIPVLHQINFYHLIFQ